MTSSYCRQPIAVLGSSGSGDVGSSLTVKRAGADAAVVANLLTPPKTAIAAIRPATRKCWFVDIPGCGRPASNSRSSSRTSSSIASPQSFGSARVAAQPASRCLQLSWCRRQPRQAGGDERFNKRDRCVGACGPRDLDHVAAG
jgi:hypothetical protein